MTSMQSDKNCPFCEHGVVFLGFLHDLYITMYEACNLPWYANVQ